MSDMKVSIRTVMAWSLWLFGTALAALDLIGSLHTGHLGVIAACAGGTLHIRGFFASLNARERNAFELGRDHERSIELVPRLR